jgi:hypothetical protein
MDNQTNIELLARLEVSITRENIKSFARLIDMAKSDEQAMFWLIVRLRTCIANLNGILRQGSELSPDYQAIIERINVDTELANSLTVIINYWQTSEDKSLLAKLHEKSSGFAFHINVIVQKATDLNKALESKTVRRCSNLPSVKPSVRSDDAKSTIIADEAAMYLLDLLEMMSRSSIDV